MRVRHNDITKHFGSNLKPAEPVAVADTPPEVLEEDAAVEEEVVVEEEEQVYSAVEDIVEE